MFSRRTTFIACLVVTAGASFTLGLTHARRQDAALRSSYDAKLEAIRADVMTEINNLDVKERGAIVPAATAGQVQRQPIEGTSGTTAARAQLVAEVKQELQREMGL